MTLETRTSVNGRTQGRAASPRLLHRLRLLAACLFLGAVAFNTAPGQLIAETKLDMALNPLGFLERAIHLWDGAFFGHLQNQAYGYLFPMGPFYALWRALAMPPWDIQRLWISLVLCAAFLGMVRLARALAIGSPNGRVLAGLAYALAPHALALIGINSSEFQPSAVLPWILLPLVQGARGTIGPRRAAALSAVAFLFAGAINAAAELAVLVVPLIYLLTRANGPRKRRLLVWWLGCVTAVSLWWLVPLLLLGRYIFSFLPFIETASATTSVTSLQNVLRGSSSWISYLPIDGKPWLPAAYEQATAPWLILVTTLVAALGLTGIMRRSTPERTFLVLCVIAGVAIIGAGHSDTLAFPWAEQVRGFLDGPLAPFRNLHKFDALVRLPVALGLAALPSAAPIRLRLPVAALSVGLVGLAVVPMASAGVTSPGAFAELPSYWRDAAAWLNTNAADDRGGGMVLAVPGSRRGEYLWGRPLDEPMQSLLNVRWATHSNVPWGSAGLARLLQAIDERFSDGNGSPGLTAALRRIGVTYLLVRNDLARETLGTAWPARVHETLEKSDGLHLVAQFGPLVGAASSSTASGWFEQPYPALEVYAVPDPAPLVGTVPQDRTMRVTGAPEAVLAMAEQGLLNGDDPVLLGDEPGASKVPARDTVVTDTLRKRDMVFGDVRRSAGATLTDDERSVTSDLTDPAWTSATARARYIEVRDVTASSSEGGIGAVPARRDPGRQPYAAFDADPRTGWRSDGWNGAVGQWLRVDFTQPITTSAITVAFDTSAIGPPVSEIEVETEGGVRRVAVRQTADPQLVTLPPGQKTWLKIRIAKLAYEPRYTFGSRVGITEVAVPGVRPMRTIAVPGLPGGTRDPGTVLLTSQGTASPCMHGSSSWTCTPGLEIQGEDGYGFDRTFAVEHDGARAVTGQAVLTDPRIAGVLTTLSTVYPHVTASSTAVDDPAVLGRAAMDGDLTTLWYAQPFDRSPTLSIDLGKTTAFSGIRVLFPDSFLGLPPVKLTVRTATRTVQGWVGGNGWLVFPQVRTRKLTIEFSAPASRPIEVSEVSIPGVKPLGGFGRFSLRLPCGYGPTLTIDGDRVPTSIVGGTLDDVLNGRPLTYKACLPLRLSAGVSRISVAPTDAFRVRSAIVTTVTSASSGDAPVRNVRMAPVPRVRWNAEEREVRVFTSKPSYLVVNENYNQGWQAYLAGKRLTPVRLDGWRQAWALPAADGTVVMRYEPDTAYRGAMVGGWVLVFLVLLLAVLPGRRRPSRALPRVPAGRPRVAWALAVAPLAGLWVGGTAGALIVSAVVVAQLWLRRIHDAQHVEHSSPLRVARLATSPWVTAAVLALAGLSASAGAILGSDTAAKALSGLVPQVLCLVVVALLLAAATDSTPDLRLTPGHPEITVTTSAGPLPRAWQETPPETPPETLSETQPGVRL